VSNIIKQTHQLNITPVLVFTKTVPTSIRLPIARLLFRTRRTDLNYKHTHSQFLGNLILQETYEFTFWPSCKVVFILNRYETKSNFGHNIWLRLSITKYD
jgi:hypothetical protein